MAKAYWIVSYRSVKDPEAREAYSELARLAALGAGGRFLVHGGRVTAREEGIAERTVVVEWDSYEQAVSSYEDPAYRRALDVIKGAAVRDFRIVEGVD
jgi:uncharacterized protein (DUF1330 family)